MNPNSASFLILTLPIMAGLAWLTLDGAGERLREWQRNRRADKTKKRLFE